MNKAEFIAEVAAKTGSTKAAAADAVNAFTDVVKDELSKGGDVRIAGFGTFSTVEIGPKEGKLNFGGHEGQVWTKPAHKAPKFKAGSGLKEAVK